MAKLTYKLTESDTLKYSREANEIMFDIDDNLTIDEFKLVCMRLAAAMGYSSKTIKNSFGMIDEHRYNIEDLINEIKK